MRIVKFNRGYTMMLSDHEFAIINRMFDMTDKQKLWDNMPTGERRAWSRRTGLADPKPLLRIDRDKRTW